MEDSLIKILLIEDDVVDQMSFKRMVRDENLAYDYTIASSVSEAKLILGQQRFDIIVSDYLLGGETGFEVFEIVDDDTPFILITGSGSEAVAAFALKEGVYDYLIKDLERNYLQILPLTIARAIEHRRVEDTLKLIQFERSVAGVFRIDLETGQLLNCNETFAHILGYTNRATALNEAKEHFNSQDWPEFLTRLKKEKFLTNQELQIQGHAGQSVYILMNLGLLEEPVTDVKLLKAP